MKCGYESSEAMILAVINAIIYLCNWVKKPEKLMTSMGFKPVTSRYWCDALTN